MEQAGLELREFPFLLKPVPGLVDAHGCGDQQILQCRVQVFADQYRGCGGQQGDVLFGNVVVEVENALRKDRGAQVRNVQREPFRIGQAEQTDRRALATHLAEEVLEGRCVLRSHEHRRVDLTGHQGLDRGVNTEPGQGLKLVDAELVEQTQGQGAAAAVGQSDVGMVGQHLIESGWGLVLEPVHQGG